jgi:hypothetical protein
LQASSIDRNYFGGFGGQSLFFETARSVEHLYYEFKKEKDQEKDDPMRERERTKNQTLKEAYCQIRK